MCKCILGAFFLLPKCAKTWWAGHKIFAESTSLPELCFKCHCWRKMIYELSSVHTRPNNSLVQPFFWSVQEAQKWVTHSLSKEGNIFTFRSSSAVSVPPWQPSNSLYLSQHTSSQPWHWPNTTGSNFVSLYKLNHRIVLDQVYSQSLHCRDLTSTLYKHTIEHNSASINTEFIIYKACFWHEFSLVYVL